MTVPKLRRYPFQVDSSASAMASDEVMLETTLSNRTAAIRFYAWAEPTLSLGYFQSHADRGSDRSWSTVAWLRRTTGGKAILHHHELTYALALPAGEPWQNRESWICRMHHVIIEALARFGVEARAVACGEERRIGDFLCFLDQTPGDLVIGGHKIAGSAQRRPHGAILQHGSILLKTSPHAPMLAGIHDLCSIPMSAEQLAEAIQREFLKVTGWPLEEADWTPDERAGRDRIMRERYTADSWNRKR